MSKRIISTTFLIVLGSTIASVILTIMLGIYDVINDSVFRLRFWLGLCSVGLFIILLFFEMKGMSKLVNWFLIGIYELLAFAVLLTWGLGSVIGVVMACFTILLPGVLMQARQILTVSLITFGIISLAHAIHSMGLIRPAPYVVNHTASILDIISYMAILSVFGLVSWSAARQKEKSLTRALMAEETLKAQKESLAKELKEESRKLRQAQLLQIQQLYRFAVIGQSAVATLHELSNHLSVLNLDLDNIKEKYKNSRALSNAESSIAYINKMVRAARAQLNASDNPINFNVMTVIDQTLKDIGQKSIKRGVSIVLENHKSVRAFIARGDPLTLMQVLTILLNNAIDACSDINPGTVTLKIAQTQKTLSLIIIDNGPGIDDVTKGRLFEPLKSSKPTGLGVGLYIARHLTETRLNGTLKLVPTDFGTAFKVSLRSSRSIQKSK